MSKPAQTYQQQLNILKSRGLIVPDEPLAVQFLEHHNYYRLSAYRFPFTVIGAPDQFLPGTTFADLTQLYHFDRVLRQVVMEGCKRVEISVRSRFAYEVGHQLGPLSYIENQYFTDPLVHARTLTMLDKEMTQSKEEFIKHHRNKLKMPWPPVWVIAEIVSFGNVSNLLMQLQSPSLRQAIADTYHLDESTFCSLFHHLSVLRNTAAHHSRLWNKQFVITFQLPRKKPPHLWPNFYTPIGAGVGNERRIYNSLILLVHLVQTIDPVSNWPWRLLGHLKTLAPRLLPDMGFPIDWSIRPMWQYLLQAPPPS